MDVHEAKKHFASGGDENTLFKKKTKNKKTKVKKIKKIESQEQMNSYTQESNHIIEETNMHEPMDTSYQIGKNEILVNIDTPTLSQLDVSTPMIPDQDSVFGGLLKNSPTISNPEPLGPFSPTDNFFGSSPLILYINSPTGTLNTSSEGIGGISNISIEAKDLIFSSDSFIYDVDISNEMKEYIQLNETIINDTTNSFIDKYMNTNPIAIFKFIKKSKDEVIIACNNAFLQLIEQRIDQTLLKTLPQYLPYLLPIETQEYKKKYDIVKNLIYKKVKFGSMKIRLGNYVVKESFLIDQDVRYCKYDPVDGAIWDNYTSLNGKHFEATVIPSNTITESEQNEAIIELYERLQNLEEIE